MLAKARDIAVSEVVIDLEDAVVPERKPEALALTVEALAAGGFAAPRIAVRINAPGSAWHAAELQALAGSPVRPDSIVVPKVGLARDVTEVDELGIPTQALIESAASVASVQEIAGASGVEALILGYADLAVSLGRTAASAGDLDRWGAIQDIVVVAARAAGIRMIDGAHLMIADEGGLRAAAGRVAALGFDGKWAIHPAQIAPIADAFRPSEEEVMRARAIVDALAVAEANGDGAVNLDGLMVDEPVRLGALRTLKLAGER
jgi:citrate lyase subunit beta/citryl-CoA lyase